MCQNSLSLEETQSFATLVVANHIIAGDENKEYGKLLLKSTEGIKSHAHHFSICFNGGRS